jgi:tRNA(adenine34) deaminase
MDRDERFMAVALEEARVGLDAGEIPIGAVLVHGDDVLARAHWRFDDGRLLDHPELLCLLEAERNGVVMRGRDRRASTLYTTLEPCALCMSASMSFLLGRVVFALESPSDGASDLPMQWQPADGHPAAGEPPYAVPEVVAGVSRNESAVLVARFLTERAASPFASWARTLVST